MTQKEETKLHSILRSTECLHFKVLCQFDAPLKIEKCALSSFTILKRFVEHCELFPQVKHQRETPDR